MSKYNTKPRLYEEIVSQLVERIKDGSLKPGMRLPSERKLADEMKVSRTVIREALRSMASLGYIESKIGGGTYVKSVTLDSVIDPFSVMLSQDEKLIKELVEVRVMLESEVAKLAAKNITEENFSDVQYTIDLMKNEIENGGTGILGEDAFHNCLAEIADNSALSMILGMCSELLTKSRQATLLIPGQPEDSLCDHIEIFAAIKEHNSSSASKLMKHHLQKAKKNLASYNKKTRKSVSSQ